MSHVESKYRYTIEAYRKDISEHLGSVPIQPDFHPVLEWAALEMIRKNPGDAVILDPGAGRIEPCWDDKLGNPYLSGIRAVMAPEGQSEPAFDISAAYFQDLAQSVMPALVESGKIEPGETFHYLVCAYPAERRNHAENEPKVLLSVKPVTEAIPVDEQSMDALLVDSFLSGSENGNQMPVLFPGLFSRRQYY